MSHLQAQHWQTRTPMRVRVLGLIFIGLAMASIAKLLCQYEAPSLSWILLGLLFLFSAHSVWFQQQWCFVLLANQTFGVRHANTFHAISITRFWANAWVITVQFTLGQQQSTAVFWRWALSSEEWRQLHIYLWRNQLQYQYASQKGTR